MSTLEVLFTPAEFAALRDRDLSQTVCIVFDVLRATSTMLTALANGAAEIIPVEQIADALSARQRQPDVLLAGERDGLRILASQTGGVDFDLGNSPREFTRARVADKTIVMTTTNGTRALRACAGAKTVLLGSFLNLRSVGDWIIRHKPADLLLVCAGTHAEAALEDTLCAGALCGRMWPTYSEGRVSDSAEIVRQLFDLHSNDLLGAVRHARNGRRLLAMPDLCEDVAFCLQRDSLSLLAGFGDGSVRRLKQQR